MPELPEVEHIARSLNKVLSGQTISAARLLRDRLAPHTTRAAFAKQLKNARINFVHRRGKHILFDLDNGRTLLTHLRMTGNFSVFGPDSADPKFTHAIFFLGEESRLVFDDQRHFGLMKILKTAELYDSPELKKLAPEPFSDDFSVEYVHRTVQGSKKRIKELLLDQTKFCGLGNIYAAEALFLSSIGPRTISNKLSKPKAIRLREAAQQILREAIEESEALEADPANLEETYSSRAGWRVYDREGEACSVCNGPIKRIKQGGRSTFYCPRCQK